MKQAQVFKQWTKREILQTHIPDHVRDEVRYLLRLDEDEAGTTPYLDIKKAIIKLFAPKAHEGLDKALGRVLTTRPSQLTKQIIEDICQCKPALNCPCCANIVYGISRRQFPTAVRNQIAKMKFDKDSYLEVLDHADEVFVHSVEGFGPTSLPLSTLRCHQSHFLRAKSTWIAGSAVLFSRFAAQPSRQPPAMRLIARS